LENLIFKYFLIVAGLSQVFLALMEVLSPYRSFLMWKKWVAGSFFPFHGLALIFTGLPLTFYKGYLSSVIFYIGLFVVLMGPFILIYPEKIRKVFNDSENVFNQRDIKMMIYFDAFFRSAAGIIFLLSCWKTFF
jgi:hypothetical protein